jgi:polyhydroxyalkanoate synthesis regulator phasin
MVVERYLGGYLDRRMKYHIEEWQLATRTEAADIGERIAALEREAARLARLEARARALKGARAK